VSNVSPDFSCKCGAVHDAEWNGQHPQVFNERPAYCGTCLGWIIWPERTEDTAFQRHRLDYGIEHLGWEEPKAEVPDKSTSRQARKQKIARAAKRTCRNGHPKNETGPCRPCNTERQRRKRARETVPTKTLTNPQVTDL
jgi:hypothetical protein